MLTYRAAPVLFRFFCACTSCELSYNCGFRSQASLNVDDPTLNALISALPEAPAMARRICLERCGLIEEDDFSFNYMFDGMDEMN